MSNHKMEDETDEIKKIKKVSKGVLQPTAGSLSASCLCFYPQSSLTMYRACQLFTGEELCRLWPCANVCSVHCYIFKSNVIVSRKRRGAFRNLIIGLGCASHCLSFFFQICCFQKYFCLVLCF